ncbi:uncharacterized protein LOC111908739 [Lactuca sativa]|uniref:Protein kinase domain-containing protein n=1 Tax=Lactuca sativa TaxID=4236 RepID=A0A9R1VCU9_LACSA|nr:uncharacterized protein LOC111908739 [Lactuca sativa]KAJ0203848.1 hypothetical protein LSAT_V11C500265880 [Lactuca sativa]
MQILNSDETAVVPTDEHDCTTTPTENIEEELDENSNVESAIDASGKTLDLQVLDESRISDGDNSSIEGLYVYKNTFNLIPRSVGGLVRLKTLKFFGNEVNLFPSEFGNLVNLERLQVKISLPGLTGLPLQKLKALKELELSKAPSRPSAFPLLGDIMGLERLTKLSVCHFSIRYLPPEIGRLTCLEYLDLSHNKMRNLPSEITKLSALITLKVANNKLIQVPPALSSLQRLENLDLSNNRLTSLGSLEFDMMHNLRRLNLQFNKLPSFSQLPSWISCDLEGNDEDMTNGEFINSSVEMDVLESSVTALDDDSINDSPASMSSHLTGSSPNRSFPARKPRKGWKRRYYLQQRARQERLNCSRKWKGDDSSVHASTQNTTENCESCSTIVASEALLEGPSVNASVDLDNKELLPADGEREKDHSSEQVEGKEVEDDCSKEKAELDALSEEKLVVDNSCGNNANTQSKRHSERDLDNPKPRKSRRPTDIHVNQSSKYSTMSFCSIEDYLPDGFYDAGRDRPFLPLSSYEKSLHLGSREVIVMDREKDEELDAVTLCAQSLLYHLNQMYGSTKDEGDIYLGKLQVASLLALFVSDHFGGSDRSTMVDRARKSVSGSNYNKPFVCTCPTGNNNNIMKSTKQTVNSADDTALLCERSLQLIKARRNSIVVPIGTLQFGVCRHRSLLMKYLCDRMEPQVPCELVRGYLDFAPHAWNVIVVKRGDSDIRMVVDACRPHDIREETDPEYFYRYIPLNRINGDAHCSFPSLSAAYEDIKEGDSSSTTLIECNLGSVEAAAKVRTLKVSESSAEEVRNFEYSCLGEVRLLSVLKHPCIVKVLGHQICTKWLPSQSEDGIPEHHRILQSAIFMEHVKGGSLKGYIEKLGRSGEKHVPVNLGLQIARDVAWALSEVHSKDIIHRDLKSENILVEMDESETCAVVKVCDFDRAVPLRSWLHTCCIGHMGIPPPDVCVGTPRWMAPEVYRTIHDRRLYGLEVDIWSFGCLLLELLTLQVPYVGLPESKIHDLLLMGKRPQLTDELEALGAVEEEDDDDSKETELQTEEYKTLRFLIDIYRQCTQDDPYDRPTAIRLYKMLLDFSNLTSQQV